MDRTELKIPKFRYYPFVSVRQDLEIQNQNYMLQNRVNHFFISQNVRNFPNFTHQLTKMLQSCLGGPFFGDKTVIFEDFTSQILVRYYRFRLGNPYRNFSIGIYLFRSFTGNNHLFHIFLKFRTYILLFLNVCCVRKTLCSVQKKSNKKLFQF